ncbi:MULTISPECIES: BREX-1 system adenine-specific DNA-methyltransferase PglX [unclassified Microbacterium]|uniref:BREX-1 system adenine-specific DNA-methyltransferase PglX n=1 Tax=unclassified Microbacterium TaxID=2609290 RepID=UPI00214C320D|nr:MULTISPECIES: BREX-1 system adenine-specific DNA-methyltransferase PglX [unclassified Microbacterium]MCR2784133.1 BREX-1 system adenine-specific DNA-methyltransferase PglX [Microbacterium sp. zg.B96]WIM15031.1 BREX-1 system adenine-specific DNA-methyltransferase PglX [Microbacterium sp. zg-B96]
METAPLKSFATRARTDLIKEVGARVTVVLAENSLARVESHAAVRNLEAAITRDGRDQVVDRVAYTWFNRIIALRFMDANGYTPSAIVSPEAGRTTGQPEVLAEAKAGSFDSSVVPEKTQRTITALFNRTRPSQDPDGEAYGMLLEAYCRSWHKAMPFMFEREGDYTELLIPAALLAVDSVRDRAVKTLSEDVCRDVEVIGWLYQFYISERKAEVFDGFKKNKKAGAAEIPAATQLFTPHWIVRYLVENSLGRLWLLNNPTSRLAEQMDYYITPVDEETDFLKIAKPEELKIIDPAVGSGHMLTYAFDLLYAIYMEKGYDPAEIPSLILQHNLFGTEIDPRAGALAAFALTMKAAAKRKLFLKNPVQPNVCVLENVHFDPDEVDYLWSLTNESSFARGEADEFWNAFMHADTFGSLIQPKEQLLEPLNAAIESAEADGDLIHGEILGKARAILEQARYLSQSYSIAVANPPYMGAGTMGAHLAALSASEYRDSKSDLFAMFIERCWHLVAPLGAIGMISMQSWMFLPSFRALRERYVASSRMSSLIHLGAGAFDTIGGEVVSTVAWVWNRAGSPDALAPFIDLTDVYGEAAMADAVRQILRAERAPQVHLHSLRDFSAVPGGVLAYRLDEKQVDAFAQGHRLGEVIELREGINTGENERFLRRWWEVSQDRTSIALSRPSGARTWLPYKKGGPFRRWAGNEEYVVDWSNDGAEIKSSPRARPQNTQYFFRESVSWTRIAGSNFSLRYYGPGLGFDSTGPSGFGSPEVLQFALAFLNSRVALPFLGALSPTLDFRLGNLSNLPVAHGYETIDLSHVDQLIELSREDWNEQELSWGFASSPLRTDASVEEGWGSLWAESTRRTEIVAELEGRNDDVIADAYGLSHSATATRASTSLFADPAFRFPLAAHADRERLALRDAVRDLTSYAVGCMFGRYSLDEPGLILADQGSTLQTYLARVPSPAFMPDQDNVIPIVDGDWFEDDIVARFRKFLRVAFGEEHFEENLRFVTESLGVKDIRDYFVKSFYEDHVKRYKKRPIYWLFRSPKGSFSALIYLHRYNPSTASTVLTGYLREFIGKLEANLEHQGRVAAGMGGASPREVAAALKEADRIRKLLVELRDYEHDVLFPLAGQQIALDLDDGVLVNYQKLGAALKDIGLKRGSGSG